MVKMNNNEKNFKWIGKNYNMLVKKYNDKWIAVLNERVVESGSSLEPLKNKMRKKYGEAFDDIVFEFITNKKFPSFDTG